MIIYRPFTNISTLLWLHSKHGSALAEAVFNIKLSNGCYITILSALFLCYLYSLLLLYSNMYLDVLPVCLLLLVVFFFFSWRCWLLQYVVFLLHLSQDHKCMLAVWSLGVTCICFVTHNAWILSQLIVYVSIFATICTHCSHMRVADDVIVLSHVILLTLMLICVPIPVSVYVQNTGAGTVFEWSVFVVYGL